MRKNLLLLLITPTLFGCSFLPQVKPKEAGFQAPEVTTHNYFEIESLSVSWTNMFMVPKPTYFLYFYSQTCSHCAELKDLMIETALHRDDLYFVKASEKDILLKDVSSSIGVSSPEQMSILGYPSLVKINNGVVEKNVAGKTQIKQLLNI